MSNQVTINNNSTVIFGAVVCLVNNNPVGAVVVPRGGINVLTAGAGDTIKAFNADTYNPNDLGNGSLIYSNVLPAGCEWSWFIEDFVDNVVVTALICDPPIPDCENAVACACDPPFGVSAPHLPPPTIVFWNTQQCATASCPAGEAGDDVTICVDANRFSSTKDQQDADAQAYSSALAQAQASLVCGIRGQLSGLLWELPSLNLADPCTCGGEPAIIAATAVVVGDANTIYNATLRIRGLVELMPYAHYVAGTNLPGALFKFTNPAIALPITRSTGANEYILRITNGGGGAGPSVAACYGVNNQPTFVLPSSSQVVDYTFTAQVRGGSVVTLELESIDNLEWSNIHNLSVGGGPPPILVTEPYKANLGNGGQFLQMDCLSIF